MVNQLFIRIVVSFILLGIHPVVFSQTPPEHQLLDLESCIQLALSNNMEIIQREVATGRTQVDLKQARYNLLPSAGAGMQHTINQGRVIDPSTNLFVNTQFSAGYQYADASLTLFDGLASFHRISEQAMAVQAAKMDELSVKNRLAMNVAVAYSQALAARDMIAQIKDVIALSAERLERNEVMHEEGAISPGDYADFRGEYHTDLNRLLDGEAAYVQAMVALAKLLNIPYSENITLSPLGEAESNRVQIPATDTVLFEVAASHLGFVRAADFRRQQADYTVRMMRARLMPELRLSGGFQSNYSGNDDTPFYTQMQNNLGRFAALRLTIPIFSRLEARNDIARAKLSAREATFQVEAARNELQQDVEQALAELRIAMQKYGNLQSQVSSYNESFRVMQVRFEEGDINSVDFLTTKNRLDNANINLIIAKYQWYLRQFIVDFYNGDKNHLMDTH